MAELSKGLSELAKMKVVTANLGVQLKSCQDKLNKMLFLLPSLFNAKYAMEQAIPSLQACIRAQKARKFRKLTGGDEYTFIASNMLSLTLQYKKLQKLKPVGINRHHRVPNSLGVFQVLKTRAIILEWSVFQGLCLCSNIVY